MIVMMNHKYSNFDGRMDLGSQGIRLDKGT